MNLVVSMLLHQAKAIYAGPEYKRMKQEAGARFDRLREENREMPGSPT